MVLEIRLCPLLTVGRYDVWHEVMQEFADEQ